MIELLSTMTYTIYTHNRFKINQQSYYEFNVCQTKELVFVIQEKSFNTLRNTFYMLIATLRTKFFNYCIWNKFDIAQNLVSILTFILASNVCYNKKFSRRCPCLLVKYAMFLPQCLFLHIGILMSNIKEKNC